MENPKQMVTGMRNMREGTLFALMVTHGAASDLEVLENENIRQTGVVLLPNTASIGNWKLDWVIHLPMKINPCQLTNVWVLTGRDSTPIEIGSFFFLSKWVILKWFLFKFPNKLNIIFNQDFDFQFCWKLECLWLRVWQSESNLSDWIMYDAQPSI